LSEKLEEKKMLDIVLGEEFEYNGLNYLPVFYSYNGEVKQLFGADIQKIRDYSDLVIGYKFGNKWYRSVDTILDIIRRNLKISFNTEILNED
jgi:hypothetical protein